MTASSAQNQYKYQQIRYQYCYYSIQQERDPVLPYCFCIDLLCLCWLPGGCLQQSGINQLMQIVSEAIFERLKQPALLHTSNHNKLAFVTSNELIVRQLAIQTKCYSFKLKGREVIAINLQNALYVVLLYQSGLLQVRRAEQLYDVVLTAKNINVGERRARVRVTNEAIYILCGHLVEKIYFCMERQREQIFLSQKQTNFADDMLISSILQEQRILILQFDNVISFEIQGVPIARLQFDGVSLIRLLRDPLLIGNINMKEYLIVIQKNKWLKIFDVMNLRQVLQMELFVQKNQGVDVIVDPLHEYMMIRIYDKGKNVTTRNSLLKINKEYYLQESKDPFFLFDIEVCLREDLILFPTHTEIINDSKFHSIDMCFFTPEYIKIATLVVDINHRTRLYHTHHMDPNWAPIEHWNEIISNLKSDEPIITPKQQRKIPSIQRGNDPQLEWNKFIKHFWQQNLQKFQTQGITFNFDKPNEQIHRYLEYPKQGELQDGLNTLSGSSSFRSSGSGRYHEEMEEKLLRMIQGVDFSVESEKNQEKHVDVEQSIECEEEQSQNQIQVSQTQEYFKGIQSSVLQIFQPIQQKINDIDDKLGRFQDVHLKKLKKNQKMVKQHVKQVKHLQQNIPKWCEQQIHIFGSELKQSLNFFNATITRLEIMGARNIKKMKKGFKDYVAQQIETRQQKAEQNEANLQRNLSILMKQLGIYQNPQQKQ